MDFSGVLMGLSVAQVVIAIVAAGAIAALPWFGAWCVDKVAGFFTDRETEDTEDAHADDEAGEVDEDVCGEVGHDFDGGACIFCGVEKEGC